MTKLLEQAVARLSALPNEEQDAVAKRVMHDLDEDRRWSDSSRRHVTGGRSLADEALAELDAGRTKPLDLDRH